MPSADGEEIADCFFVPTRFVSWTSFASLFSRRITGEVKSGNRFGAKNHGANFRVGSVAIGQIQWRRFVTDFGACIAPVSSLKCRFHASH